MKLFSTVELFPQTLDIFRQNGIHVDVQAIRSTWPKEPDLKQAFGKYDIILVGISQKLVKENLALIKKPTILATQSVGTDHIDPSYFEHPLVRVVNIKAGNSVSVAEHIMALILALKKQVLETSFLVWDGKGHRFNLPNRPCELSGKTLGLIGSGTITREVIKLAMAFNLKLICHTRVSPEDLSLEKLGVRFVELDELLQTSDIVNILVPLTPHTRNMISKEKIKLMKPDATFINAARTEVADTHALIEHADKHPTFTVGLDIDVEGDLIKLLKKPRHNVIVTPHTAGLSYESVQRMQSEVVANIIPQLGFVK